jgi:hypothetical protein
MMRIGTQRKLGRIELVAIADVLAPSTAAGRRGDTESRKFPVMQTDLAVPLGTGAIEKE